MHFYEDVVPLCALIATECINVGASTLFKAATLNGVNYYVFTVYASAISTLVLLLPLPFILRRSNGLPPFKSSLLFKIFLLGLISLGTRLCAAKAIEYSSPTLAAAMSNLIPAFTFILAIFFRMEKAELRSSSTLAKIIGTVVSISGALVIVLFRGPTLKSASFPSTLDSSSAQKKWVLGGFLLLVEYLVVPIWYILQTQVIKEYPAKLIVVFLLNLCGTIISAPVSLIAEPDLSAWKIKPDITFLAIIYSGLLCTGLSCLIEIWGLHLKGPVYVSMFRPLSLAIAAAMGVIFLGEALHLGSVIGAAILSVGFYAVIWGKAKEEEELKKKWELDNSQSQTQPNSRTPLLQSVDEEDDNK
ncbi:hypothetical protein K1719_007690 [Acacia pycnantha]|nr:hypothetical protein K1719_007690 [Acacia pycnantha]